MGSAGALIWTPIFLSCLRDGRLTSEKVSIGQCGPWISRDAFSRETTADPGGGGGGGGGKPPGSAIHLVLLTLAWAD